MERKAEEYRGQLRSIEHLTDIEEGDDGSGQNYVRLHFEKGKHTAMAHGGSNLEALANAVSVAKMQHNAHYGTSL